MQVENKTNAVSVNRVGDIWERWQKANPEEASAIRERFTTLAIVGSFKKANAYLVSQVSNSTGLDSGLVREFIFINRHN